MKEWMSDETRFPQIFKLAKPILCINASSIANESCFTSAGYLIGDLQTLTEENLAASLLSKSWISFLENVLT